MAVGRRMANFLSLISLFAFIAVAQPAQAGEAKPTNGPIGIQSGCLTPPCGEIYNDDSISYWIARQDCDNCGWIWELIYQGQHKGGYYHDGVDWDLFEIPGHCEVTYTVNGSGNVRGNLSTSPMKVNFDSTKTIRLKSHRCW